MPLDHHKEIAKFLREKLEGNASVAAYRDNNGERPIPIGQFDESFYSTIGAFDMSLPLPAGSFEFAAFGSQAWLANSIASSIYWLSERICTEWPLVCEDVVKHNAESKFRHMVYVPSRFGLRISTGQEVNWLLGVPISDDELQISSEKAFRRAKEIHPEWLTREGA
ncbi:hypothetical protein [Vreelandella sp. GE22]